MFSEKYRGDSMPIVRAYLKYINDRIEVNRTRNFRRKVSKLRKQEGYSLYNSTQHVPDPDDLSQYMIESYGMNIEDLERIEGMISKGEWQALGNDPRWQDIISKGVHADKLALKTPIFGLNGLDYNQSNILSHNNA
jgi:hypothetical protein